MTEFKQQYLSQPWEDANARRLRELASRYLHETEDYDQMRCRHRKGKMAIPVTPEERCDCTQNAMRVRRELQALAETEGLVGSLWEAIQREGRHFERDYRPPETEEPDSP